MEQGRPVARVIELSRPSAYNCEPWTDLPVSRAVVKVMKATIGAPVMRLPALGGSVPMYLFLERAPVIGLPIVNHDNNQHAADENLRLQNLWDGIDVSAGLMKGLGAEWK